MPVAHGTTPREVGSAAARQISRCESFAGKALSVDLEVNRSDGGIRKFAAVKSDTGKSFVFKGGNIRSALLRLDDFARGSRYLLGHNIISHDIPYLRAANPQLGILRLPVLDTLRVSPLAFPRNPYHNLVKHYKDGRLARTVLNDPELDSRLALKVFDDQWRELTRSSPSLLAVWHWLASRDPDSAGSALKEFFKILRREACPTDEQARAAAAEVLESDACSSMRKALLREPDRCRWPLAYGLAWISVAGGNSVMPPWVKHQFPEAGRLVRDLRDTACGNPECGWCGNRQSADKELTRWFGYDGFRPEPRDKQGRSMQQSIVETAMARKHVLGILPTGTGKSLCYQIPALSRYDKTGALTVVISPLVALMADQVRGLERHSIDSCVTINGLLSSPERADALDRVRLGDASIVLVSPEQLRSSTFREALEQREVGSWVLDEAHCLSKWGHDFRPDYRYVARFIKERTGNDQFASLVCLTATAKPDVVDDIVQHFRDKLGVELEVFNGGAERSNLVFNVVPTEANEKFPRIKGLLNEHLPDGANGGAIIYCATRRRTKEVAEFLQLNDLSAEHFHAGVSPELKKDVQERFISGDLKVIVATNAFGMGIDKPDVRLVIHADIPGSLENYFQEAGRAGRDGKQAHCIILFRNEDVERQFAMTARSRLKRVEIHGVLRSIRTLNRKNRLNGEVIATPGELLVEDDEKAFEKDSATDDTRVRTAIAWLEESELLIREENRVRIFPSSLRVNNVAEAEAKLKRSGIVGRRYAMLLAIAVELINADANEGVSTDDLMVSARCSAEEVRYALYDLERIGISSNDTRITAFVHAGVKRHSLKRFEEANALEIALIARMQEEAHGMCVGEKCPMHLRSMAQALRDDGIADPLPDRLLRILRSLSFDGRGERNKDGGKGSIILRARDSETVSITLQRNWKGLAETARLRREGARLLLAHLIEKLPRGTKGIDLLVETTVGDLLKAIEADLLLASSLRHSTKLLDRALLWLHEQEVIRLNKGMAVFRSAMRMILEPVNRGFGTTEFQPLNIHYKGQVQQIHIMGFYAEVGLDTATDAERLARDYFTLKETEFIRRWMPRMGEKLGRETTQESWRKIVEVLKNPDQQRIVTRNREGENILVLAGPGSGKTRVLVHRIAYLIRVKRENPRGILALAYNRHAAVEIRKRLHDLVGNEAKGVMALTCHAFAMRLVGASFANRQEHPGEDDFKEVLRSAAELLRGGDLPSDEAESLRERLLTGFRWILVDEYQDIGEDEYKLISEIAGCTLSRDSHKLTMFAVGDDDQNIYSFKGTSSEFIRRFERDYKSKPIFLLGNYRSTKNIIAASNTVIEPAKDRMKAGKRIEVNRARKVEDPGGAWESLDPVGRGQVQLIRAGRSEISQARAAMAELWRLSKLSTGWNWNRCAVLARNWEFLEPVRAICESQRIPVDMGNEENPGFWRLRETQYLLSWLKGREAKSVDKSILLKWPGYDQKGVWYDLLRQSTDEYLLEYGESEMPIKKYIDWLAEWGRDLRREQQGLLLTSAHGAKGLEFDHVVILDGGWTKRSANDVDGERRLLYVAMTRACQTLALTLMGDVHHRPQNDLLNDRRVLCRSMPNLRPADSNLSNRYRRLNLKEIDIGFAGRRHRRHRIHRTIGSVSAEDPLQIQVENGRWKILDRAENEVGRLASNFRTPSGMTIKSAKALAIFNWSKEISNPDFHPYCKCDEWEVVVPEVVFAPERSNGPSIGGG